MTLSSIIQGARMLPTLPSATQRHWLGANCAALAHSCSITPSERGATQAGRDAILFVLSIRCAPCCHRPFISPAAFKALVMTALISMGADGGMCVCSGPASYLG